MFSLVNSLSIIYFLYHLFPCSRYLKHATTIKLRQSCFSSLDLPSYHDAQVVSVHGSNTEATPPFQLMKGSNIDAATSSLQHLAWNPMFEADRKIAEQQKLTDLTKNSMEIAENYMQMLDNQRDDFDSIKRLQMLGQMSSLISDDVW